MKRGKYKTVPESFRELLKTTSNWKKVARTLCRVALGGYEFQNYNGARIIAEPNIEAMKLLIFFCWGKYQEVSADEAEAQKAMKQFSDFISQVALPVRDDIKQETTAQDESNPIHTVNEKGVLSQHNIN